MKHLDHTKLVLTQSSPLNNWGTTARGTGTYQYSPIARKIHTYSEHRRSYTKCFVSLFPCLHVKSLFFLGERNSQALLPFRVDTGRQRPLVSCSQTTPVRRHSTALAPIPAPVRLVTARPLRNDLLLPPSAFHLPSVFRPSDFFLSVFCSLTFEEKPVGSHYNSGDS